LPWDLAKTIGQCIYTAEPLYPGGLGPAGAHNLEIARISEKHSRHLWTWSLLTWTNHWMTS